MVANIQSKFKCLIFRPFMQCYKRGEKGPINSALSDMKKIVGGLVPPSFPIIIIIFKLEKNNLFLLSNLKDCQNIIKYQSLICEVQRSILIVKILWTIQSLKSN